MAVVNTNSRRINFGGLMNMRNIFIAAGIAILAPYVIRRVLPLLRNSENATPNDWAVAGKDSVRDAADDLGVGGISGTLNRAVGRVADRLPH